MADSVGQPQPGVLITLRRDGLIVTQTRTAADGTYRFVNLPAGAYNLEVTGMGLAGGSIVLDGQREHMADIVWAGTLLGSTLQGRVFTSAGAAAAGVVVHLLRAGAEIAYIQTDSSGAFRFTGLPGGVYALAVGVGAPLATGIQVDEDITVTRDLTLPVTPGKALARYFLFPGAYRGRAGGCGTAFGAGPGIRLSASHRRQRWFQRG